jgi:hypothetical protein
MLFDANAVPADGAVKPVYCWNWPASTGQGFSWPISAVNGPPAGAQFYHGLVVVYSTGANCTTKTISNTAFFTVQVQ